MEKGLLILFDPAENFIKKKLYVLCSYALNNSCTR